MSSEHKIIYLEPIEGPHDEDQGRMWCQDNVWHPSDYEGGTAAKYILFSEHEEVKEENERLKHDIERHIQTANALASEAIAFEDMANRLKAKVEALEDKGGADL
jgi:hypothetical protein